MVLARILEPVSKLATIGVLEELGVDAPHRNTLNAALKRSQARDYRGALPPPAWRIPPNYGLAGEGALRRHDPVMQKVGITGFMPTFQLCRHSECLRLPGAVPPMLLSA